MKKINQRNFLISLGIVFIIVLCVCTTGSERNRTRRYKSSGIDEPRAIQESSAESEQTLAGNILDATGIKGGLIVHVGCGNGKLTAALRANDSYMVHGLDTEAQNIQKAREYIKSLGIYGKVSVDRFDGNHLPYRDNLVNLVVAEELDDVSKDEVMRVLCPHGVAYIKNSGKWTKTVKQRTEKIDEWTHYLHDASGNAVAHDSVVDFPRGLQWVGSPRWARHHDHMASMSALVSTNGRIFYIFDEGPTASIELPSEWSLIARDAFNGTILWKRSISSWYPHMWPFKSGHAQLPRRLVAVGDRVYVTLGLDAPLTMLDAASGETIRTYKGTRTTEEVITSEGVLFLLVNEIPKKWNRYKQLNRGIGKEKARVRQGWPWNEAIRWVMAVEADTGEVLWKKEQRVVPLSLVADQESVFFHNGEKIVCLNRETGNEVWSSSSVSRRSSIPTCFAPTLVVYQDVVLFSGGDRSMTALSAETGKTLWTADHPRSGHNSPEDLLVVDGLVWAGATASHGSSGVFTGRDPLTGEVKKQFPPDVETYWFHQRCYRSKATDQYILPSRTGIEFIDIQSEHWTIHHWVRGGCLYGIMPCNGLIYAPPHDCACYIVAKQYGFNALTPKQAVSEEELRQVSDENRLERGPAYGEPVKKSSQNEWPTYRHDSERSGYIKSSIPTDMKNVWQTNLGGKLSSVVIADNKVFVAKVNAHTVYALDANSGETLWNYTAGARVDSPPTIYQGRVLFGSADGWVYCLRASDGKLIWRFRAAPVSRRLMSFEQLESVWPVHGSVLVQDGIVYCVAGRSMFLDEGMRLLRLEPKTGRKLSETILDEQDPETGENLQAKIKGLNMPVALPDVLSSDGKYMYMRSQRLDLKGNRSEVITPTDATDQMGEGAHLIGTTGFLDGSWFHRSYWFFGKTPLSGYGGYYRAGRQAPAGRIMVFDDSSIYGYARKQRYYKWTTPLEYHLFSASKKDYRVEKSEIEVAKSESLNPADSPLTVETWIKAERNGVIFARGGSSHGYVLFVRHGKPQFATRVSGEINSVSAKEKVTGKWVHLAGVLTADKKLQIYVNGRLSGFTKASGFIASDPNESMQIGADEGSSVADYGTPFGFTGIIDEVKIYHDALGADEIKKHYSTSDQMTAEDAALVLYYSFDQGDATDDSENKNDGKIEDAKSTRGKLGNAMKFTNERRQEVPFMVKYQWSQEVPLHARAMVIADKTLFIAGPPDVVNEEQAFDLFRDAKIQANLKKQNAAFEGRKGAILWAVSTQDGEKLAEYHLESLPVWDGMAAATGKLYISTTDGKVLCFGSR